MIRFFRFIKRIQKNRMFKRCSIFGKNFKCFEYSKCINDGKRENVIIGDNVSILGTLISCNGGKIKIGDNVTIRGDTRISSIDSVCVGNNVIISNNVVIMDNNSHPTDLNYRNLMSSLPTSDDSWSAKHSDHAPVRIEDSVWLCERCVILKGVTIGRGSIVACDSVVTKNVPPMVIVAGNPAKVVKNLEKNGL